MNAPTALPTLTGTAKQVSFAAAIRTAWIAAQLKQAAVEAEIAGGDFSHLIIGPHLEDTQAQFAKISAQRLEYLSWDIAAKTTAKQWITCLAGWFATTK